MTELKIKGMTCNHCKSAVENALKSVDGVNNVEVDLENGVARVDGAAVAADMIQAVEAEGYQVTA